MDAKYRIDELALAASLALARSGTASPSARVSALPDRRMLRYYTTLGLLDRPAEVPGRVAYYGRRHLLQIVAIKRLQADGASLADVQRRLAGASTAQLEKIADLPAVDAAPSLAARTAAAPAAAATGGAAPTPMPVPMQPPGAAPAFAGEARRPFWREPPSPAPLAQPVEADPALAPAAVRLAPGVTLVLDAARPLSPADHEAVRAAAAPFIDHLSTILEER